MNGTNRLLVYVSLATLVCLSGCRAASNPQAEADAVVAAKAWLSLVDGGKYAESWDEAAPLFQAAVSKEQWLQAMQGMRKPFGNNLSRELKSQRYRTSLPGAPDGEYVVIQFKASFENKAAAVETITPMQGRDGTWRVSGYYMK
jgi:hypothetical protein